MKFENYTLLKTLALEEILGNKGTRELSLELGFKFDKYKRWLNNEKILKWDEFYFLCDKLNYDLDSALKVIVPYEDKIPVRDNFFLFLKKFNLFENNSDVATYLNTHVSVVQRYSKGEIIPDTETIFKLIGKTENSLSAFFNQLFKNNIKNESLKNIV